MCRNNFRSLVHNEFLCGVGKASPGSCRLSPKSFFRHGAIWCLLNVWADVFTSAGQKDFNEDILQLVCAKLDFLPCRYFTAHDWHFWGFSFIRSSNISLNQSISWQHVCAVTSVFPHRVGSYVKTSIPYICQGVSSLNLAGLHFLLPSLPALFPTSCRPPFFLFFSPFFLESPSFSHRVSCWRLGHCFLLEGNMEGGREEAGWLPGCQLWLSVSVRKSRGDRCDDDRGTEHPRDWFQLENSGCCHTSQTQVPQQLRNASVSFFTLFILVQLVERRSRCWPLQYSYIEIYFCNVFNWKQLELPLRKCCNWSIRWIKSPYQSESALPTCYWIYSIGYFIHHVLWKWEKV